MDQTKQTEAWVWARRNRPKIGYGPERTDPRLGMGQTKQIKEWIWTRRNRPMSGYWPDRKWVWIRWNRPMFGYWPDRTYPIQVWAARQNRPNFGMGPTERPDRKFVQTMSSVAPDPPVRDPGPSVPYLSWVADFILGTVRLPLQFSSGTACDTWL